MLCTKNIPSSMISADGICEKAGWQQFARTVSLADRTNSCRRLLATAYHTLYNYIRKLCRILAWPRILRKRAKSFPFDSPRRLGRHVIDHAVDALHLVDDAGGGAGQEAVLEGIIIRRHAVGGGDGAQCADMVVSAPVAHHAYGAHRQQHREGLPDLVVEPGFPDLVQIDHVSFAQYVELLWRDLTGNADGKAGPGKGMAADKGRRQAQLAAQRAHLVLEQFAQRFDQLHFHLGGKPVHIVMRLDGDRW